MGQPALKRTPLYETHVALDGRLVEFGGWEMPVLYTSIVKEHHAVRDAAGLFDISHMGEFLFEGPTRKSSSTNCSPTTSRGSSLGKGSTRCCARTTAA